MSQFNNNNDLQKRLKELLEQRSGRPQTNPREEPNQMYGATDREAERQARLAQQAKFRKLVIGGAAAFVGIIIGLIVLFNSYTVVKPGHAAVQHSLFSGVQKETVGPGMDWHAPWVNLYQYPTSTEIEKRTIDKNDKGEITRDDSIVVNTGDGKSVHVAFTYNYSMQDEKLPHIFTKFRRKPASQISNEYIDQQFINNFQNIATKHSVLEVYSQERESISKEVNQLVKDELGKDGIILEQFTIVDVVPDEATRAILQQIADEQNKRELVIRQRNTLKEEEANIAQQNANNLKSAEGAKAVAEVKAAENANVAFIEAEGRAKANKELASSITPALIQWETLKTLPSIKFPVVMGDGGAGNILNFPQELLKPAQ